MFYDMRTYIVNNIAMPIDASREEAFSVAKRIFASLGVKTADADFSVFRRSVDARKKSNIKFVYSISVSGHLPKLNDGLLKKNGISELISKCPDISFGEKKKTKDFVIVGSGPCGLFCSLLLAEQGFRPLLIERGGSVEQRKKCVDCFQRNKILDTSTNIQFGAGGAGTFSDGKLVTRINDPLTDYTLKTLVRFGAPEEILFMAKPHIGTDILSVVIQKILDRIEVLGGRILYNTLFLDFEQSGGNVKRVITDKGHFACDELVLAIGHSARDTYKTLIGKGLSVEAKSFSVGMRIEHLAEKIDTAMYGEYAGHPALGHAEYNLSYDTKDRGVYTFCMCPGGIVVPSTSEDGSVVSNGMSYHARDGVNSNSAVCCTIFKEDFGSDPLAAIEFQREIERKAFIAAGADYSAPIITVGDFLNGTLTSEPTDVKPTYMDGRSVVLARPTDYLPSNVTEKIKNGILDFDRKIQGFASSSAVLTGAETRTSAPVRILRNNDTGLAFGYTNLYPSGEGAGYAGGITSAAIDGLKTAINIMRKYSRG